MFHDCLGLVRRRDARLVLLALAVSTVGDGAVRVGLLLRVHDGGGEASATAVVLVAFALPLVLLAGVAGRLADLADVRPVLVGAAALQTVAALGLASRSDLVATSIGVLVLQAGFALANSAWVVSLPRLVADTEVGSLVSLHHAVIGIATPIGAAVGGLLFQRLGDAAPFLLDAVSFAPLLLASWLVPRQSVGGLPTAPAPGLLRTLLPLDGLAALRRQPLLAALTAAVLPFIVVLESVNAVEVFLVKDVLGGSSAQFGGAEALAGVAAVAGALAAVTLTTTAARARGVAAGLGVISVCQLLQGLAPGIAVYVVLAAAVGLLLGGVNALVMTLMVTATDPRTRGRVVALVGGASRSCTMLALALGGVLGTLLGPRATFVVVGLVGLVIATLAQAVVRRRLALSEPRSPAAAPPSAVG